MSITLMSAAWKTQLPSTRKIVLLALCDNSNDMGECYPSIPMIAAKCSLKERVVYDCLRDLERGGFLRRESRPGRSTLYQIADPRSWYTPASNAGHHCTTCTPASDAPLHDMQDTPASYAYTPASDAPITITKPSINRKRHITPLTPLNSQTSQDEGEQVKAKPSSKPAVDDAVTLPDWLPPAAWQAFIDHRQAIKAKLTHQAQKLAITKLGELREQGHDPAQVINQSILNGWKGVFPIRQQQQQQPRRSIHDERAATIAELTGRNRESRGGQVIDIIPINRTG